MSISNTFKNTASEKKQGFFEEVGQNFTDKNPQSKFYKYLAFMAFFGILYISNTHYADNNVRKMNRLQKQVDTYRSSYTALKARFIRQVRREKIKEKIKAKGLQEIKKPAYHFER